MSKKIKILVDAEVLIVPHFSGIGEYTLNLLFALDKILENKTNIEITLCVYFKRIKKIKAYGFKNFKYKKSPFSLRINNFLKIKNLQPFYDLIFGKYIYFFPNYTSWPLLFSKSISVIYDLSFEKFPQYVEPNNQKFLSDNVKRSIDRSSKIITISKNSRKEIAEFYNIKTDDIDIIYPGINQSELFRWPLDEVKKIKAKYGIYGKYILFVGNIEPRKNLKNLLLSYEKLDKKLRSQFSILLIGARGWLDDEIFDIIKRLRINGNHIQQPNSYVIDKDKAALYSGASLFVYPSKYEGFGIPPLEAMACGVPTITSNNSSLPEAVGNAAKMIDAKSVDQLSSAMEELLINKDERKQLIKNGFEQINKFSWDNEAKKIIDIFDGLNNE